MALDKRIDQLAAAPINLQDRIPFWDTSDNGSKQNTIAVLAALIGSAATGTTQSLYIDNATGATVNEPTLIGKTVLIVFRGSVKGGKIITTGTPTGEQILFNGSTGDLTPANEFVGEELQIIYV